MLALLLCVSSCGEEGLVRLADDARHGRLALDRLGLQSRIERLEATGGHADLLQAVTTLLEEKPVQGWTHLDDWSIASHELRFVLTQNNPSTRAQAAGSIRALDVERKGHPLPVMARYADELAQRGIDLFVVPVPNRVQAQSDLLPGGPERTDSSGGDLGTARLFLALNEAGIEVLDLLPVFSAARAAAGEGEQSRLFLNYNPHWSPRGVSVAADFIAQRVRGLEWFEPGPHEEGRGLVLRRERLPCSAPNFGPEPEAPLELLYDQVLDSAGRPAHARDLDSPILIIGDSYSAVYRREGADLASQLYSRLGIGLDYISLAQGGANSVWQALARRRQPLAGKKLVIWVFSMSVLGSSEMTKIEIVPD